MEIGIVGAGSIGMLFGSYLSEAAGVTFYVRRTEQAKTIQELGITRINDGKHIEANAYLYAEINKHDCIFICVKQFQLAKVLPYIYENNSQTPLFFIQNGMGHEDIINQLNQPVFIGVVTHGSLKVNDCTFTHTGVGKTTLSCSPRDWSLLKRFVKKIDNPGFSFETGENIHAILAEKLIVNAVINPLTAILDIDNGEINRNSYVKYLAEQLCIEACIVFKADEKKMWRLVLEVAEKTAANTSSMRKDLQENRKTEIDAICGYILNHAERPLETVPHTAFMWHAVKAKEQNIDKNKDFTTIPDKGDCL